MTSDGQLRFRNLDPTRQCRARLACVTPAEMPTQYFDAFSESLTPSIGVLAIQFSPGLGRLPGTVEDVITALLPWTDRPLAVYGHGAGAVLAYGVAVRLELARVAPVALVLGGLEALGPTLGVRAADSHQPSCATLNCPVTVLVGDAGTAVAAAASEWAGCTQHRFDLLAAPRRGHSGSGPTAAVVNEISDCFISAGVLDDGDAVPEPIAQVRDVAAGLPAAWNHPSADRHRSTTTQP